MSLKTDEKWRRASARRIARAEATANATVNRAIHRVLAVLRREESEWKIRLDRRRIKPAGGH